ncbi:MAG: UbiA family prenyltransferase [Candidatus Methanomethylophilaceae archaeon]|nr:UbiA family prenyltransferase [Candidatus Methanomethylophilaceae archaeon]MDD4119702.1 UbiA family prenyltransferase [Candidatus Methanomethylophilaceae archaeon]MDD4454401.1 UbiA family prenyltransferase [Candidatus Methanomethylophilaceae archaeon]
MNRYLRLFRLGNAVIGFIGVIAGAFVAEGLGIGSYWLNIAIACLVVVAVMAGGNSVNDYVDRDIDRTAHPERPVPSGEIAPRSALRVGLASLVLACMISVLMGSLLLTGIVVVACALMISYEMVLKQRGFIGNLTIGVLTGMVFLFGGAVVGNMTDVAVFAVMAFLATTGREVAKDIEDMEGDEGRNTLPMSIGERNAAFVSAAFFIAGPLLSLWPFLDGGLGALYLTVLLADAMFIYAARLVFRDPHKAQKTAKTAMFAALVAFVLGALS